jgi:hypothetical protein
MDRRQQPGGSMNVTASIAAAVIVAGSAIGFAGPAQAADDFSGTFIPNGPGLSSTWVVTPCGPDCAHVADSSGWSAEAHPFGDVWRFVADLPNGTKCNNDGVATGTVAFKVDASRQQGTMLTTNPATWCPFALAPGYSHEVIFTLTRI